MQHLNEPDSCENVGCLVLQVKGKPNLGLGVGVGSIKLSRDTNLGLWLQFLYKHTMFHERDKGISSECKKLRIATRANVDVLHALLQYV